MKNIFKMSFLLIVLSQLTGCFNLSTADANEEVVLIPQPYVFGSGGVLEEPVGNGSSWVAWSTKEVSYIVSPLSYEIAFVDVISSDNVPIDLSATAIIQISKGETPVLHENFGTGWYKNKVERQFNMLTRNFVRDNKHKDLMNDRETIQRGQLKIADGLARYIKDEGIPVELQSVILGKANPPKELLVQIAETAAQTERSQTETQRKLAEDTRKEAETSKANADKAYQERMAFTPSEYLTLRSLEIEKEKIQMVKDKQNVTIIMTSGGGNTMGTFKVNQP
jgi:uncharacterized membrane protein YqiK